MPKSPAAESLREGDDRFGAKIMTSGLVLRIELKDADTFAGSVGLADSETGLAFDGWISFMAAIDQLLRPPSEYAGDAT
jgi:hypothetical protein